MNTTPIKPANEILRSILGRNMTLSIVMLVAVGSLHLSGCSDDNVARVDRQPIGTNSPVPITDVADHSDPSIEVSVETDSPPAEQEQSTDLPDESVLQKASQLFEKAKSTSGNTASGASQWVQETFGSAAQTGTQTADETWKWANDTFESLKSQGLTSANSTSEWLGQDWKNMESWEYKVLTLNGTDDELGVKLNELGKSGWECFQTEVKSDGTRFYLKKPTFSYLRHLPFKDVIKLVPLMSNGEK